MGKNELSVLDPAQLPSTQNASDNVFDELAKSQDYLGRLQLFTKGKAVDKRLIRGGEYGVPKSAEDITVLGEEIHVLVLARRAKAIDMSDSEAIFVSHDNESDEFKRIAAQSQEKESHCMYGPSFLVYEESTGQFLEFFCGSKSARNVAKEIYPFLPLTAADIEARGLKDEKPHGPLPMTLRSKLVEKGTYTWHVPVVVKRSTPITPPSLEKAIAEINKFINPPADGVERVPEAETKATKKSRAR
jgi:hypothetical protein